MLSSDDTVFPANMVKWVGEAMKTIDPDIRVFRRPLRNTDPEQSIGVFAQMWTPDEETLEMQAIGHPAPQMPTVQHYTLGIQGFVKDSEEERGLNTHAALSSEIRKVVYTNEALQIILRDLKAEHTGYNEHMRRWGIRTARYFSGEINSVMLYLSTLEMWIETEIQLTN